MRRPSAAVVNERDELFVKDDICIRVFDKTGLPLRDIGYKHFTRPFGEYYTHSTRFLNTCFRDERNDV